MSATQGQLSRKKLNIKAFFNRHQGVSNLLSRLQALDNNKEYLTDQEACDLGIEFSSLNLHDGKTSEPTASFFYPADKEKYDMANSGIDFDVFLKYPHEGTSLLDNFPNIYNKMMGEDDKAEDQFDNLVDSFIEYASPLCDEFQQPSNGILGAKGKSGESGSLTRYRNATAIHDAQEFQDKQRPHRMIVISSTNSVKSAKRIAIAEIIMLLSWMEGGMRTQTYELVKKGVPASRFHMIFPVLAISFFMPTHARVIQSHFDDGKLKIQFTDFHNFKGQEDVPHYTKVMNSFLRWAGANPCGDTLLADKYPIKDKAVEENKPSSQIPAAPSLPTSPTANEDDENLLTLEGFRFHYRKCPQRSGQGSAE